MGIILHPAHHLDERREPPPAFFDMRWRFDFAGRPSVYGKWSSPTITAWDKQKEGVVRAVVEGKNRADGEVKVLAECDGHDFVNFKWMVLAATTIKMTGKVMGPIPPPIHGLVGMQLVTREWDYRVFPSGKVERAPRDAAERQINYATFGR